MIIDIIGAGPGGIYAAYKLAKYAKTRGKALQINIFEKGNSLELRKCPISAGKVDKCVNCKTCSIMCGFGGAGAFSDGKYNITNDFGGTLFEKIGADKAIKLMKDADAINFDFYTFDMSEEDLDIKVLPNIKNKDYPPLFSSKENEEIKKECIKNNLRLMDADIRHLGTDKNYIILERIYNYLKTNGVSFYFNTEIKSIKKYKSGWLLTSNDESYCCNKLIVATGRSGSKWLEGICEELNLKKTSNRVDIGVRVELPYEVFSSFTDKLYESKIVYRTKGYEDLVRTFCMNPKGAVVNENTNGIITVNGHSYEDPKFHTKNTNFALLVSQHFTEPFNNSNEYGESIARLSNMLGKGVIIQRFGDLIRCKRTTNGRLKYNTVVPTLKAEPGDLALVLPHRILEDIKEMIYALDTIAPGTKNDDTLLYGVEVKFYNKEIEVNDHLIADDNLYIIGDCSGITHSLSQASASGLFVAEDILCNIE